MITFLRGIITTIDETTVSIDVNGVGYAVHCHARLLANLAVGEETTLHTYHLVRENEQALYGMASGAERAAFATLLKVSGVGAKVALAILSVLDVSQLADAILMQDAAAVSQAPGVGKKLAERVVLELKGKFVVMPGVEGIAGGTVNAGGSVAQDVISALLNLGYKPQHAKQVVTKVIKEGGAETPTFETTFKAALQELRM